MTVGIQYWVFIKCMHFHFILLLHAGWEIITDSGFLYCYYLGYCFSLSVTTKTDINTLEDYLPTRVSARTNIHVCLKTLGFRD